MLPPFLYFLSLVHLLFSFPATTLVNPAAMEIWVQFDQSSIDTWPAACDLMDGLIF